MSQTAEQFLSYLRYERNASELTVVAYAEDLRYFEAYLAGRDEPLTLIEVDGDVVRDWVETLMDGGNAPATVNRKLSTLRTFYRYALSRHLVERNPMQLVEGPRRGKPLPQFVREEDMDRLLDDVEWGDTLKDVRARTILMMLYEAGLRRSELTGLDDADVDLEARQLKVTGKRDKQRLVPFGEELAAAIVRYKAVRDAELPERPTRALLVSDNGQRLTGGQVYRTVKSRLTGATTLKKRSPHVLRHSFATAMLNHGAGLESIKRLLGHESVTTTEVYTHTTLEQLRRVYSESHPRA